MRLLHKTLQMQDTMERGGGGGEEVQATPIESGSDFDFALGNCMPQFL